MDYLCILIFRNTMHHGMERESIQEGNGEVKGNGEVDFVVNRLKIQALCHCVLINTLSGQYFFFFLGISLLYKSTTPRV
jgi:hypothetical protein